MPQMSDHHGKETRLRGHSLVLWVLVLALVAAVIWAARYRIEVYGPDGRLLFIARTSGDTYEAPPELVERLTEDAEHRWQVAALDQAGQAITTSEPQRFVPTSRRP